MANTSLTTNFNISPYYDDYDETKGYYRILYRPGYAVQARELTQSQTILQKQIHRFGRHIFKEGSLVLEDDENKSKFSLTRIPYVKIRDNDTSNNSVNVFSYINTTITGATSNISALVIDALDGVETTQNTKTLYIAYLNGNPTANLSAFVNNEVLLSNNSSLTTLSSNSTGYGSLFKINDGVLFAKEHFISFQTQSIIADRYNQNANCQIGFSLGEQIVRYTEDLSLLDPALESSNYSAPGADRFKIDPKLIRHDPDTQVDTPDYIRLIVVKNGVVQKKDDRTQYSSILDEFARRTYDESGDYYVRGLNVKIRENLDDGNNFGYLSLSEGGDSSKLTVVVEPGVGYVQGYEIGSIIPTFITIDKSSTYENVNGQVITSRIGNYLICDEVVGPLVHDKAVTVYLYDTSQKRITDGKWSIGSQTGNIVGTAKLSSAYYESGTLGTANGEIAVHLFDIQMIGSNNITSNVKSIFSNSGSVIFSADTDATDVLLEDSGIGGYLYYTGSDYTRNIRDVNGNPDTSFIFRRTDSTITGTGTFSTISLGGEDFPYSVGTLSDSEKREFIVCMTTSTNVAVSGVISNTSQTGLSGVGTTFTNLNVGDKIQFTNNDIGVYTITSITNNTEMNVSPVLTSNVTSNAFVKVYKSGDIIDFTTKGATGVERTITAISNTQIDFDMKETISNTASFTVTYNLSRSSAKEATKTLKPNRYVKINCASSGVTGPFSLGTSDVYIIREIRVNNSPFTTGNEGIDATTSFTIDSGQNDYYIDHTKITPRSISLSNSNHILVRYDYFDHDFTTGKGYFSIDSYPINDVNPSSTQIKTEQLPIFKSPKTGRIYDLRNYLDFRPIKENTSADSTTIAGASENPPDTNTYKNDGIGFRLPAKSNQITFDFTYYLSRKDLVLVNKDNVFSVKKGIPSSNPITPNSIDNAMTLAVLTIMPYPSLSSDYSTKLGRPDLSCSVQKTANRRFTMRDIGVLKERIDNLEYYASLNSLEKSALEMQILDENGLNRFKNGIFVDTFEDHGLGSTSNPDYKISIDKNEKSINPVFNQESLYYKFLSNNNFIYANSEIGLATLSYDEVPFLQQPFATTDRNIETSVFNFGGVITLTPPTDVWVDTTILPPNLINTYVTNQGTSQYTGSWKRVVTGYKLVNNATGQVLRRYQPNQNYRIYATDPRFGGTTDPLTGLGYYTWNPLAELGYRPKVGQLVSAKDFAKFEAFLLGGPHGKLFVSWYSGPNISVRVEEEAKSILEGVSGSSSTEIEENHLGEFVTDSSLTTYIRPQYILIESKGLLPTTRHYLFFDGENMSQFTTPLTQEEYVREYNSRNREIFIPQFNITSNEGDDLISSPSGRIYAMLRIPNTDKKRFTNGNKQVIITDSRTNDFNPTSSAVTNFYASGINVTKQGLIQSTAITTIFPPLPPIINDASQTLVSSYYRTYSCLAYSFLVNAPPNEEGLFITSADIFLSSKDSSQGIWFEIREMDTGGTITRTQVPYSEVWYESDDVVVSNDSSVPFNVKFKAPVYLKNNQQYAFVIHTVGINPGYRVYVADINARTLGQPSTEPRNIDLLTGTQYTSRPITGTLYTTNNNLNWDIVDGVDLKINFYRAQFVKNTDGVVTIGNKPIDAFKANNVTGSPFIGESVRGNDRLTLSGITGGSISVGDFIIGNTSNSNTTVSNIIGSTYVMANSGFITGESVSAYYSSNLVAKGVTANVSSVANSSGVLYRFEDNNPDFRVRLKGTGGNLLENDIFTGVYSGQKFNVESFDKIRYSVVNFEPQYLNFGSTSINFEMKTVSNSGSSLSFVPIEDKNDWFIGSEMAIYSRTEEVNTFSGNPSNQVRVTMRTISDYQSPVLDLNRTHTIFIDNIINNNIDGEANSSGGELINTYISKIVTLAEKQDAEDLNVFITAYRPPGTEIYVWAKLLNGEDFEPIFTKKWTQLEYIDRGNVFSSLSERYDFIEYGFKLPASVMTGLDSIGEPGIFQYTRESDGTVFTGYKYFTLKVGLGATNSAIVPRATDLRAIALQK